MRGATESVEERQCQVNIRRSGRSRRFGGCGDDGATAAVVANGRGARRGTAARDRARYERYAVGPRIIEPMEPPGGTILPQPVNPSAAAAYKSLRVEHSIGQRCFGRLAAGVARRLFADDCRLFTGQLWR